MILLSLPTHVVGRKTLVSRRSTHRGSGASPRNSQGGSDQSQFFEMDREMGVVRYEDVGVERKGVEGFSEGEALVALDDRL